jgi:D-lactate dehydrogenase
MKEIKSVFDPENLINPGVVINNDPQAHLRNLKPLPPAHEIIDKCIECGFCEVQCPSKDLTLTPRQRIAVYREMSRLKASGESPGRLAALSSAYRYEGVETCATDGLCSTACPVSIDTGKMIKYIRWRQTGPFTHAVARSLARNMPAVTGAMGVMLNLVSAAHALLGTKLMEGAGLALRKLSGNRIPLWNEYMPRGAGRLPFSSAAARLPFTSAAGRLSLNPVIASRAERSGHPGVIASGCHCERSEATCTTKQSKVVYFPSCINRAMGKSRDYGREAPLTHKTVALLEKAGYQVVFPKNLSGLCCGMAFDSKGFKEEGSMKADELNRALLEASNNGELPIYADMSPCLYRMRETLDKRLDLYEPIEFILNYLTERLEFRKVSETVAIHTTCSSTKMGLSPRFRKLAEMCAERVIVPDGVGCCGWAGDRGFTFPELNASALAGLKSGIPRDCAGGYSTSRTCEIGLSLHSGLSYRSIVYLVDRCTTPGRTA